MEPVYTAGKEMEPVFTAGKEMEPVYSVHCSLDGWERKGNGIKNSSVKTSLWK
jgi:hypothetical protein